MNGLSTGNRTQSLPMSSETRGAAIKARRLALGIRSVRDLAIRSGVSRDTVKAAEDGLASSGTYERLEAWLSSFEEETGADDPAESSGNIVIELGEGRGRVVVRGPVENLVELEAAAKRLYGHDATQ